LPSSNVAIGVRPQHSLALVRALMVVRDEQSVKVLLQLFHRVADLLAEGNLVELIQDRLVEALADAVRLR
jgi:hypothetical protein